MSNTSADILVTVRFFDTEAVSALEARGHRVVRADIPYDAIDNILTPAVHDALSSARAWIVGAAPVSKDLLERYPALQIVARRGVGFDSVDASAIQSLGRVLTITPGSNEPAVADHAVGLMLAVGRRVVELHSRMRSGEWRVVVGTELYQKTVGLIGFGRIARQVARRLSGFDVRVLAYDPFIDSEAASALGVTKCSLAEVFQQSDYLSLHAPLTKDTRGMFDSSAFAQMKTGAILVNTSRGELIDERALLAALEEGKLAGAGLDVFAGEHDPESMNLSQQLVDHPKVVATPHSGGSTSDSLRRANNAAARCVLAALAGESIPPECIVADGRTSR